MDDLGLPSVFRVGEFAARAVSAAHAQAAAVFAARNGLDAAPAVAVGAREAAIAFRSERYLRLDGEAAFEWAPLSGDYEAADGWVRLHCNFERHAEIACRVLGVPQERAAVEAAVRRRGRFELEDAIAEAGGVAAAMRTREEWLAHPHSAVVAGRPVVAMTPLGGGEVFAASAWGEAGSTGLAATSGGVAGADRAAAARLGSGPRFLAPSPRPLSGVRVLDLTRIIAGPNAGRVLAGYGADVTMVRSPHLPTIRGLDLDLNFGKALRYLDFRTDAARAAFLDLVRDADVVLQSYRPGALAGLGLGPATWLRSTRIWSTSRSPPMAPRARGAGRVASTRWCRWLSASPRRACSPPVPSGRCRCPRRCWTTPPAGSRRRVRSRRCGEAAGWRWM